MKFHLKPIDPAELAADVLICFCWENELKNLLGVPSDLREVIAKIAQRENFIGKESQILSFYPNGIISSFKFLLYGLGKKDDFDLYKLYKSVASSAKKVMEAKPVKVAFVIDEYWMKKYPVAKVVKATVESIKLANYLFNKYKSEEDKKNKPFEDVFLCLTAGKLSLAEQGLDRGEIVANAVNFARDLINEPPEVTSPSFLAQVAQNLASESNGNIRVKIFDKEDIAKLGMNSFLGVSLGSDKPPKFIHLSYKLAGAGKKVVLIGKGITFDTGGLSLKSAEHMETMKLDMSGAASVLGVFQALAKLKPKIEVVGLIAACENMPSGKAAKPGDIFTAMNGKSIEVLNTDAEGRLTLADAISYANIREKPDEIIDLATLTGACMVALGEDIAGLWGNNEKLIDDIVNAAKDSAEFVWKMPLFKEYNELIKSHIADVKNIQTGKYGGAITAALFLHEFVGKTPWIHLDIAGPSYSEKDTPLAPAGGAGFGVRLLLEYLAN